MVEGKNIDYSKHAFTPKHVKLTEKEIEDLLLNFNVSRKQLPKIHRDDPAIAEMDVKKGDIIKITRKSETMKESFYYRVVMDE
ncbi:MAG: DNA-directed RNA polymerase subunit H [Candidatus Nanoarchaeia archaeon]|nr:DNA-directed RNA polymerase subunit H [Candidatus Nanoarchaeia archaeon]